MATGKNWKEVEAERRKGKIKTVPAHAFEVKNYKFFPCAQSSSLKQGYRYFLQVRNRRGILSIEVNSPRFKTEAEAREFAATNQSFPWVLG